MHVTEVQYGVVGISTADVVNDVPPGVIGRFMLTVAASIRTPVVLFTAV